MFTTAYPDQAARTILSLLEDLGYATIELLLAKEGKHPDIPRLVQFGEATADALERVLGMKPGCLKKSNALSGELADPPLVCYSTFIPLPGGYEKKGVCRCMLRNKMSSSG